MNLSANIGQLCFTPHGGSKFGRLGHRRRCTRMCWKNQRYRRMSMRDMRRDARAGRRRRRICRGLFRRRPRPKRPPSCVCGHFIVDIKSLWCIVCTYRQNLFQSMAIQMGVTKQKTDRTKTQIDDPEISQSKVRCKQTSRDEYTHSRDHLKKQRIFSHAQLYSTDS